MIKEFEAFIEKIEPEAHQKRMREVLQWIIDTYPTLEQAYKWNQPMFTDHGTFIIGFSVAKHHFSIANEKKALDLFTQEIAERGYDYGKMLWKIKFDQEVDYDLLGRMIDYNMKDKADYTKFWRV